MVKHAAPGTTSKPRVLDLFFDGAQLLVNAQITTDLWLNSLSWVVVILVIVVIAVPNMVAVLRGKYGREKSTPSDAR